MSSDNSDFYGVGTFVLTPPDEPYKLLFAYHKCYISTDLKTGYYVDVVRKECHQLNSKGGLLATMRVINYDRLKAALATRTKPV
jgi:hypothetical protein